MPVLKPSQIKTADQSGLRYHVTPDSGTTIEDMLKPDFWKGVTAYLHPSDRIEVEADDGSFYADLIVRDVGKSWAKVILHHKSEHPVIEDDTDAWKQEFTVTSRPQGIVILRNDDNAIVGGPFESTEAAVLAARNLHRR